MPMLRVAGLTLIIALVQAAPLPAQETAAPAQPQAQPETKSKAKAPRRARMGRARTFMGRPIADVMSYEGADWLIRETREQEEQPEAMLDALKIPEGATVADVGAGVGYYSLRLARRVGTKGVVWATDLQPQMLRMLSDNARAERIKNIRLVRATPTDPKLPADQIDLILMVNVYHECSDPVATLKGLRPALKPGGRLVLVEFRAEDPDVPIKPEHKMTFDQVRRELEPRGFTFKEKFDFLPWQHIIVFEKPADEPSRPENGRPKAADTRKSPERSDAVP